MDGYKESSLTMNEDWEKAIEFVLQQEGGYGIDPKDPGGETNFGISRKSYPTLDIKNLTIDEAKSIYKTDFWNACSCDQLPWGFSIAVFDMAVNQGTKKAMRLLQIILDVDVDGIIGEKTIAAAHKANPRLVKKYLAMRLVEYAHLMTINPALSVYGVNWSFRVLSLFELIFKAG